MSLLITEGFEGTGTPSGWTAHGSINFDYSAVPLAGSQSMRCDDSTGDYVTLPNPVNVGEFWFKFLFKAEAFPTSGLKALLVEADSGVTFMGPFQVNASGQIAIFDPAFNFFVTSVDAMSTGTTYNVWGHWKKGAGNTGVMEMSFDAAGNPRPSSGNKYVTGTNGGGMSNDVVYIFLNYTPATGIYVYDDVQIADTDMFGGAVTVTVNLTGVGASPAVGTLTFNGSFSVAGVAATPAIGTGTVTTAPPATVTVTLTGVGASPAIGIGTVTGVAVVTPPDQGLVTGGPPHWYGILKDEKVYLTGVSANPQVGTITPMARGTLEELEKMYPFPKRVTRLVPRRKTKPTAFVYMLGVHPVPKIGSVTTKMFYEDDDEELSSILKMMDVDEEVISALKLAK